MKSTLPGMTLAIWSVVLLTSCGMPNSTPSTSLSNSPDNSIAGILFQDVNTYRTNHGVPSLTRHAGLDHLAQEHCEYLRKHRGTFNVYGKNVSHVGSEGRSMIAKQSFNMINTSENVAFTTRCGNDRQTAHALLTLWKNSHDHEYAMLQSEWTDTGVAVVTDTDGSAFATQLFGTVHNSQRAMNDRFIQH